MTKNLQKLVEMARQIRMTDAQKEEQRLSFAYGNTKIENNDITRETVERQAEALKKRK